MTLLEAALLGVIQGLTEFLPISSSAHLILAREIFGWGNEEIFLEFDVACHVGTLLAVLFYFRSDILAMSRATSVLVNGKSSKAAFLLRNIVIGTIPVALVGFLWADLVEVSFRSITVVGVTLALGAFLIIFAEFKGTKRYDETALSLWEVLLLGIAQATALVPGVSRSGVVIAVAMLCGLRRDKAARFAFLLGIPAILAAAVRSGAIVMVQEEVFSAVLPMMLVGGIVSALVGYVTVKYFIFYLETYSLNIFAGYRVLLSVGVLLWVL